MWGKGAFSLRAGVFAIVSSCPMLKIFKVWNLKALLVDAMVNALVPPSADWDLGEGLIYLPAYCIMKYPCALSLQRRLIVSQY